jgi:regulator of sigma E protease
MISTIIAFILILGVLIFVHELGHFLTARFFGVKAEEFGFGFPPRIFGLVFNNKKKKWEFIKGNKEVKRKNTVYSLNWIPIGGFVKILGEDGHNKAEKKEKKRSKEELKKFGKESPNFSHKPIWQRIVILTAGVTMNFVLAIFILSIGFLVGTPEPVVEGSGLEYRNMKIQVVAVIKDSPAEKMGMMIGDEIVSITANNKKEELKEIDQVLEIVNQNKGKEIVVAIKRGDNVHKLKGTPRENPPQDEGALGFGFDKIGLVSYPFHKAFYNGFVSTFSITIQMIEAFGEMFGDLFFKGDTEKIEQVSGPIGIVVYTNQMNEMGFSYLLRFAAILSINLAIINILPIPALDGGRILFLIFEKIKGKPVSQRIETGLHTIGMYLLLLLMVVITIRDVDKFRNSFLVLWEKFSGLFS